MDGTNGFSVTPENPCKDGAGTFDREILKIFAMVVAHSLPYGQTSVVLGRVDEKWMFQIDGFIGLKATLELSWLGVYKGRIFKLSMFDFQTLTVKNSKGL